MEKKKSQAAFGETVSLNLPARPNRSKAPSLFCLGLLFAGFGVPLITAMVGAFIAAVSFSREAPAPASGGSTPSATTAVQPAPSKPAAPLPPEPADPIEKFYYQAIHEFHVSSIKITDHTIFIEFPNEYYLTKTKDQLDTIATTIARRWCNAASVQNIKCRVYKGKDEVAVGSWQ